MKNKLLIIGLIIVNIIPMSFSQNTNEKIKVQILYNAKSSGLRYRNGIMNVLKDKKYELTATAYVGNVEGEKLLEESMDTTKYDVILGPTESEVFSRVLERNNVKDSYVTVVSGTATAKIGNDPKGYFFRLNLDAKQRVEAMWNYLDKYWISTIAVFYENTEFGRNAERAFKELIPDKIDKGLYYSVSFDIEPLDEDLRDEIDKIINERPELVGLFCERDYVEKIYKNFKCINSTGMSYNPMFFSVIDIVKSAENLNDFYFPSLKKYEDFTLVNSVEYDEVYTLGQTTALVLNKAIENCGNNFSFHDESDYIHFRNQIVKLLSHNEPIDTTNINSGYLGLENQQFPQIYKIKNNIINVENNYKNLNWFQQFVHKVKLIGSIFKNYIILNIIIILFITYFLSKAEIRKSFPKKHIKIHKTLEFYIFMFFHVILILCLYIYLAEARHIKYTDTLMVILISLTPTAFLKTTIFETSQGKSIGLERIYKQFTDYLDDMIMNSRYTNIEALVNIIAYNNSENTMRRALTRVYKNNRSVERSTKLIQVLDESLGNEHDYLNRRRLAAKFLIRLFDRHQLKAEGFVPFSWDYDKPLNPLTLLRFMAKHCSENDDLMKKVEVQYNILLDNVKTKNEESCMEILSAHNKELSIIMAKKAEMLVMLRFIVIMDGFDTKALLKKEFLTQEIIDKVYKISNKKKQSFFTRAIKTKKENKNL